MTHFRFRHKRVGYLRWRYRFAHCRAGLRVLPRAAATPRPPAWWRTMQADRPGLVPVASGATVLQVGAYVVSAEGDPRLWGHPNIRY